MLLRDKDDPSKDGVKTRKIEFMVNYFEMERLKAAMPSYSSQVVEIQRVGLPWETFHKLDSKYWS